MKRTFRRIAALFVALSLLFGTLCLTACDAEGFINELLDGILDLIGEDNPQDTPQDTPQDGNYGYGEGGGDGTGVKKEGNKTVFSLDNVAKYSGKPYTEINGNQPFFTKSEITDDSYEYYGDLDDLGRCTPAHASIGKDLMPTEDRGSISSVKPTGWHSYSYDIVDGKSLYNRCHLIGFQLTGENANRKNLITGTRYLNVIGMLPFENQVADYINETDNHVMYRVTPVFVGANLVASGVLMEGYSVEDEGDGICFNIYCYNIQPGIYINYANGESRLMSESEGTALRCAVTAMVRIVVILPKKLLAA